MKIGHEKFSNINRVKKIFVQRIMTRALAYLIKRCYVNLYLQADKNVSVQFSLKVLHKMGFQYYETRLLVCFLLRAL